MGAYEDIASTAVGWWDFADAVGSTVPNKNIPYGASASLQLRQSNTFTAENMLPEPASLKVYGRSQPLMMQVLRRAAPQTHLAVTPLTDPIYVSQATFSVGLWFWPQESTAGTWSIYHRDNSTTSTPQLQARLFTTTGGIFSYYSRSNGGGVSIADMTMGPVGLYNSLNPKHLAWEFDTTEVRCYVNGFLATSAARSAAGPYTFNRATFGHATSAATPHARVGDIMLFDTPNIGADNWRIIVAGPQLSTGRPKGLARTLTDSLGRPLTSTLSGENHKEFIP